jgi:hypothetical protein
MAIDELICPNNRIRIVVAYEGSGTPDVPIFHYIGAVFCHPQISLLPSQFARKPSRGTTLQRIGRQQPCLGVMALRAFESAVLKAVRGIRHLGCQHPSLALGAARALDGKKFRIGLSHGTLARIRQSEAKTYDPRVKAVGPVPDRSRNVQIGAQIHYEMGLSILLTIPEVIRSRYLRSRKNGLRFIRVWVAAKFVPPTEVDRRPRDRASSSIESSPASAIEKMWPTAFEP